MTLIKKFTTRTKFSKTLGVLAALSVVAVLIAIFLSGCAREPVHISSHADKQTVREWMEQIEEIVPDSDIVPILPNSPSMGLTVSDFSYILVQRQWEDVEEGCVIVFYTEIYERLVHQVIERDGDLLRTKGIGNARADPGWVTPDRYIGTMVAQFYFKESA